MKITFFSDYLNHHQLPFCLKMSELLGEDFKFISTVAMQEYRVQLGYKDLSKDFPFVITTYDSEENEQEAMRLAIESDVVIHGMASEKYVKARMKLNKLTFRYSERIFKSGKWHILSPRVMSLLLKNHVRYNKKNMYVLCASAYTAGDFAFGGAYKGKTYKWGYFPEVKKYDNIDELIEKKDPVSILWVGRLINCKKPEVPIIIAKRLKDEGYNFKLNIIGIGEKEEKIRQMITSFGLNDCVCMLGSMSPAEVREHMEKSSVYLFTSNFNEGWGAVLNESMNSGCAVVASHAIGSVPFLVEDGKNGFIYKNGDIDDLYRKVKKLLDNPAVAKEMGKNAYNTLCEIWNAEKAADRIIKLSYQILSGDKYPDLYKFGPCSKAECFNNNRLKVEGKNERR